MENIFDQIIETNARALPVILLLDTSGSMQDNGKIAALNTAVNAMMNAFGKANDADVCINTAIITFGGKPNLFKEYGPCDEKTLHFTADGMTPLGGALKMAKEIIEDKTIIKSRDYRPTVIVVSDGMPNDNWKKEFDAFVNEGRSSKCFRWALSIGFDATDPSSASLGSPYSILKQFVTNTEYLFSSKYASELYRFFEKVTVSTVARTKSVNPNVQPTEEEANDITSKILMPDFGDDDESMPF